MRAGIRSSSTCLISQGELMVQTISRRSGKSTSAQLITFRNSSSFPCLEFKFTQTAVLEESTSQIDFTPKTSSHPSSNSSCPLPASLAVHRCEHIEKADDYEKLSVQPQSPIIRFKATHLKRELRSALFFRFLVADDTVCVLRASAWGNTPAFN